eukprot:TRINITY_DN1521_c0_g1_i1.p3 TRINITY_DN1521_c0_g1~~TRINITY_DN1521_c0_g1_i1.p3  ORF type:complete len:148 (-),score=18.14 TRINITY_DN1521_c0_g1_i1:155-598(-)
MTKNNDGEVMLILQLIQLNEEWEEKKDIIKPAIWASFRNKVKKNRIITYFEAIVGKFENKNKIVNEKEELVIAVCVEFISQTTEFKSLTAFDIPISSKEILFAKNVKPLLKKNLENTLKRLSMDQSFQKRFLTRADIPLKKVLQKSF